MKGQSTIRPQPPDRRAVSILVRSWTGWRGKPHWTYLAFLEVDRANTPRLDIAALQAEGIDQRFEILKITVRGRTARVHDAFRNSLVVKVEYFFPPDEIFEQGRAARARAADQGRAADRGDGGLRPGSQICLALALSPSSDSAEPRHRDR